MDNSLLFCADPIDALNDYISESIDPRLYLFAYYEPMPVPEDCDRCRFWSGVLNLYGLFFDCGPFLHRAPRGSKSLLKVLEDKGMVSSGTAEEIIDFIQLIRALRTLYCHNASGEDFGNRNLNDRAMDFFGETFENVGGLSLSEKEWEQLLGRIDSDAQQCLGHIRQGIKRLSDSLEKQSASEMWLLCIKEWCRENPIFLNSTLEDYCELLMHQKKTSWNPQQRLQMISSWRYQCRDEWQDQVHLVMRNSSEPLLPYSACMRYLSAKFSSSRG